MLEMNSGIGQMYWLLFGLTGSENTTTQHRENGVCVVDEEGENGVCK